MTTTNSTTNSAPNSAPKHIVVIGAGVGGLGTALALSREGHRVTILERDATPTPTDPDSAFEWDRRGAPQVRHSHALLARLRNLLRDFYPDVLERLLAAGATEMRFADNPPPEMIDREPRNGDDDLVAIACRRTTFEWVLRTAVLEDQRVVLRDGVVVNGFSMATDESSGLPRVIGVHITQGDEAETIESDLVVAATGRRSGVPGWLAEHGVELETKEEDTGIIYLSRFYRTLDGAELPELSGPIGGDLGYLKYAIFVGDNRTYSVTFALRTGDKELRSKMLDPDLFDHAAQLLPATTAWSSPDISEAITPVHAMGGLLNRRIRFLGAGEPLVLGFHAVGDAHTCSNPLYGRGCSLAMVQARLVLEAIVDHPDDAVAQSKAYEAASAREIEPWYKASVAQDRFSREQAAKEAAEAAALEGHAVFDPPTDDSPIAESDSADTESVDVKTNAEEKRDDDVESQPDFVADLMRDGLMPALRTDPVVFRAFIRAFNLLEAPDSLMNNTEVIGRVLAVYQEREGRAPEPPLGPSRSEMLDHLNAFASTT